MSGVRHRISMIASRSIDLFPLLVHFLTVLAVKLASYVI